MGFGYARSLGGFFLWFPSPTGDNVPIAKRAAFVSGKATIDIDGAGKLSSLEVRARTRQARVPPSVQFDLYADIVTREQSAAATSTLTTSNGTTTTTANATSTSMMTMTPATTSGNSTITDGKTLMTAQLSSIGVVVGWRLQYQLALLLELSTDYAWMPRVTSLVVVVVCVAVTLSLSDRLFGLDAGVDDHRHQARRGRFVWLLAKGRRHEREGAASPVARGDLLCRSRTRPRTAGMKGRRRFAFWHNSNDAIALHY